MSCHVRDDAVFKWYVATSAIRGRGVTRLCYVLSDRRLQTRLLPMLLLFVCCYETNCKRLFERLPRVYIFRANDDIVRTLSAKRYEYWFAVLLHCCCTAWSVAGCRRLLTSCPIGSYSVSRSYEFCSIAQNALIEIASKPFVQIKSVTFCVSTVAGGVWKCRLCFWNLFHSVLCPFVQWCPCNGNRCDCCLAASLWVLPQCDRCLSPTYNATCCTMTMYVCSVHDTVVSIFVLISCLQSPVVNCK